MSEPLSSHRAPRIASLVPSLTELAVALGLGARLVARTGYCTRPATALAAVPKVGGTKDVNLAKLRRLAPTHLLVNIDENRLETVQAIASWPTHEQPTVIVTHPQGPADVPALIDLFVQHFGREPGLRARAQALHDELAKALALPTPDGAPLPVLYLIWREPWMTVARDTYISRLLARAGWQTWPAVEGGERGAGRYPVVRGDEDWLGEVREVLLSSEPYAFGPEHLPLAQALCPRARVRLIDGELASWYGPRTAQGLRLVREMAGGRG